MYLLHDGVIMPRYGAILLFYTTPWHDEFDLFVWLTGCSRLRRLWSLLLLRRVMAP